MAPAVPDARAQKIPAWSRELIAALEAAKEKAVYRDPDLQVSKSHSKTLGRSIDFSSNDYLGFSSDPRLVKASQTAMRRWGTGSAASRLLSGNLKIHRDLEKSIARLKGEEDATVFSSGYLANLGVLKTLASEKDLVILDRLCHASLIDGARLSGAKIWVYEHRNAAHLEALLKRANGFRRIVVVTDSYFSMDGDVAPLPDLERICRRAGALLVVDEAHATGVYGKHGGGLTEHFGLKGRIPVVMGTLSKALGSVGGFIAGPALLRKTLINFCRAFIYTTAPSPAASGAAIEAIRILHKDDSPVKRLWRNVGRVRQALLEQGWELMGSEGPIVPVRVGDPVRVMAYKKKLMASGILVSAIRTPTVAKGTERLRISLSAAHRDAQIEKLLSGMKRLRTSR